MFWNKEELRVRSKIYGEKRPSSPNPPDAPTWPRPPRYRTPLVYRNDKKENISSPPPLVEGLFSTRTTLSRYESAGATRFKMASVSFDEKIAKIKSPGLESQKTVRIPCPAPRLLRAEEGRKARWDKRQGRRQEAEGTRQKTEDRRQKAEAKGRSRSKKATDN